VLSVIQIAIISAGIAMLYKMARNKMSMGFS